MFDAGEILNETTESGTGESPMDVAYGLSDAVKGGSVHYNLRAGDKAATVNAHSATVAIANATKAEVDATRMPDADDGRATKKEFQQVARQQNRPAKSFRFGQARHMESVTDAGLTKMGASRVAIGMTEEQRARFERSRAMALRAQVHKRIERKHQAQVLQFKPVPVNHSALSSQHLKKPSLRPGMAGKIGYNLLNSVSKLAMKDPTATLGAVITFAAAAKNAMKPQPQPTIMNKMPPEVAAMAQPTGKLNSYAMTDAVSRPANMPRPKKKLLELAA